MFYMQSFGCSFREFLAIKKTLMFMEYGLISKTHEFLNSEKDMHLNEIRWGVMECHCTSTDLFSYIS